MKRQQFVHRPAMVGDPGRHGRRRLLCMGQTLMRCAKVIHRAHHKHPFVQCQGVTCQRPAPTRQRREAFPERRVQPVTVDGGVAPSTPGSRAGLLPLSPLRTARESFPSSSSSLANAPCGTRSCHVQHMRWHDLHHTRLEPPHRHPVGECTSQCRHCRHLPSLLKRLAKVSGDARPDGRQRAFAWSDVAHGLNPYPPHYRMAFASSILLFPHACRLALRLAFPCGRRTGFPCSVSVTTNGVGALCPPVALLPMTRKEGVLVPATVPFWPKPASTFGLFSVTMFIERSPGFAIPSILAPSPSWC